MKAVGDLGCGGRDPSFENGDEKDESGDDMYDMKENKRRKGRKKNVDEMS